VVIIAVGSYVYDVGVRRVTLDFQCQKHGAEEKELSCFPTEVASVGYGRIKKEVKHLAEMVAKDKCVLRLTSKNLSGKISNGWFRQFMQR